MPAVVDGAAQSTSLMPFVGAAAGHAVPSSHPLSAVEVLLKGPSYLSNALPTPLGLFIPISTLFRGIPLTL